MTRFQRINLAFGLALLAVVLALPLYAPTPGTLRATDALRQCMQAPGSVRSLGDPANPIGETIGVISANPSAQGCAEDGTAQFYSSYRV